MIDANHLPHPEHFQEYVIENNAMLNKVLHNQACHNAMICDIYQMLYEQKYKRFPPVSPNNPEVKERANRSDSLFEIYKDVVSQIYRRFMARVKKFHNVG